MQTLRSRLMKGACTNVKATRVHKGTWDAPITGTPSSSQASATASSAPNQAVAHARNLSEGTSPVTLASCIGHVLWARLVQVLSSRIKSATQPAKSTARQRQSSRPGKAYHLTQESAAVAAVGAVAGLRAALAGVGADAREAGAAHWRIRRVRVRNRQRAPRAICMYGSFVLSGAIRTDNCISTTQMSPASDSSMS